MRHMFALLALLLTGCSGEPSAPTREAASEVGPTSASAVRATQYWERSSITVDQVWPAACLGENVRFFGEYPYQYHEVTSSSGNFQFIFFIPPQTPDSPGFFAQGQTSGKLYEYKYGGPTPEVVHVGPGVVQTVIGREVYVADDGSKLYAIYSLHMTVNANGDLVVSRVDRFSVECER